ncbi:MAG: radical SAM protein [Deltaproteobacteria bacterium]|nr:radical SAM protein [Deltaproteobacteria bacterium]
MNSFPEDTKSREKFRFVFGPAPSRRLGVSLGLDLVPSKTCTLDCLYCEVGPTTARIMERFDLDMAASVLAELEAYLASPHPKLDFITLTGSGEPTLNAEIRRIIEGIKELTPVSVCVLTNGTLLSDPQVRRDLGGADLVVPSLDTVFPETFQRLNRPHPLLDVETIIQGIIKLRDEFSGSFWLEILLSKGINDSEEELAALRDAAEKINPDKIHINTVYRPPMDQSAQPLSEEELDRVKIFFGNKTQVAGSFAKRRPQQAREGAGAEILQLVGRRPCGMEELSSVLGLPLPEVRKAVEELKHNGAILQEVHAKDIFFRRV